MRQRLLSAARLPFFASYADAAAWVADRAAAIAAVLDRSTGRRLDAIGLVGGSAEHFRPQSRYGGGYGAVGSVLGPQAVELAAGYTLSEGGACRLWDKSEGEHLDEGGLEFSRVGSTCYLPSTTGLAAGDVIYSAEPVYHDWSELNTFLTAAGSGFDVLAELRNRASKGLIGGWRWRDGVIVPEGAIDFTRVTASQGAAITSVTGQVLDLSDSTFVVTGGYTLRIRNITDGANVADVAAGSWTRSGAGIDAGAAVAAAVAALIAGGKSIRCWVEGLSEFSIGGATSAIELGAGTASSIVASGLSVSGRVNVRPCGVYRNAFINADFSSGAWAVAEKVSLGFDAGAGVGAGIGIRFVGPGHVVGAESNFGLPTGTFSTSLNGYLALGSAKARQAGPINWYGGSGQGATAVPVLIDPAAYSAASLYLIATAANVVFSKITT